MIAGCAVIVVATIIKLIIDFRAASIEKAKIEAEVDDDQHKSLEDENHSSIQLQQEGGGSLQLHAEGEHEVLAADDGARPAPLEPQIQVIRPGTKGSATQNLAEQIEQNLAEQFGD